VIDTRSSLNKSVRQLRDLVNVGEGIAPLKDFSQAAREELLQIKVL
jgi:hypothetical protein